MALIAENATLYVAETKKPNEGTKWTEFAAQMRTARSNWPPRPTPATKRAQGRDG